MAGSLTELEAYQHLARCAFSLEINLNDCMCWGASYSTKMDGDDVEAVIPIFAKYKLEALMAYSAINDGWDGDEEHIKEHFNWDAFQAAKAELQPLADKGEIMYERYARLAQEAKDINDFGHVVVWNKGGMVPHQRSKRLAPSAKHMLQSARIPGLIAVGGSYFDTRKRLLHKLCRLPLRTVKNK